jgi:hypothetical protein
MADYGNKSWLELCELASKEQDNEKVLALVAEIEHLLAADDQRQKSADRASCTEGES